MESEIGWVEYARVTNSYIDVLVIDKILHENSSCRYGTFATGGCDGYVNVWDGNNKKRLYQVCPHLP